MGFRAEGLGLGSMVVRRVSRGISALSVRRVWGYVQAVGDFRGLSWGLLQGPHTNEDVMMTVMR